MTLRKKNKLRKQDSTGRPPGEIIYTGHQVTKGSDVTILRYDNQKLEYIDELPDSGSLKDHVVWVDVRGLHEIDLLKDLGNKYAIHPLILEDVADIFQRPKYEEFDSGGFFTIRTITMNDDLEVRHEHIALYCGANFIITFQETESDEFMEIRERLKLPESRIRSRSMDYLFYALIDLVVDRYYSVLEHLGDNIDEVEVAIHQDLESNIKSDIYRLKRAVREVRKTIIPIKEAIIRLGRTDSGLFEKRNIPFLRDLYDHISDAVDYLEMYRDSLNSLHDLYTSEISNKMNQVMQVLTIIATIFIPLTFIAGVYGMNFVYMPELGWHYGYFVVWAIMIIVTIGLVIYFKRKNWL